MADMHDLDIAQQVKLIRSLREALRLAGKPESSVDDELRSVIAEHGWSPEEVFSRLGKDDGHDPL